MEILTWTAFGAFLLLVAKRLMTYLHIFQQDEYSARRFLSWIVNTRAVDRKASALLVFVEGLRLLNAPLWLTPFFCAMTFISVALMEKDPRRAGKKKLAMTQRAIRIYSAAFGLSTLGAICILWLHMSSALIWLLPLQSLPLLLICANFLLLPLEKRIQQHYWNEAHTRLLAVNPTIIGITGSFGKTSVKNIVGHVLKTQARTYFPPGSINTPMGISRVIREEMPTDCRFFISEMGAYGIGSINRICALTPPKYGIITSIGEAHYERFGNLNAVAQAKFELAEAVLAQKGTMVITENVLSQPYAKEFVQKNRDSFIICGEDMGNDVRITQYEQSTQGTHVQVVWKNSMYTLKAALWGNHQKYNMTLAFAIAVNLGLTPKQIMVALQTVPQINHRLEVKPQPDGSIVIDDAYNSNLTGFSNALDVLTLLCHKGGRRILVTPGMAELGEKHDEQHTRVGVKAAACTDLVLVVGPERIPTFVAALSPKLKERLLTFQSFVQAEKWLKANVRANDVVLFENDLPDIYEKRLSI